MLIGARHGTTVCPWCQGSGEDHVQRWQEWQTRTATYVPRLLSVPCDGCAGRGRVTRTVARQMQAYTTTGDPLPQKIGPPASRIP